MLKFYLEHLALKDLQTMYAVDPEIPDLEIYLRSPTEHCPRQQP